MNYKQLLADLRKVSELIEEDPERAEDLLAFIITEIEIKSRIPENFKDGDPLKNSTFVSFDS